MVFAEISMQSASMDPTDTSMPPVTITMVMPIETIATTDTLDRMETRFSPVRNERCVKLKMRLPATRIRRTMTSRRASQ